MHKILSLLKDLVLYLNRVQVRELYSMILLGIFHYKFVKIHPFIDDNRKAVGALFKLTLYLKVLIIKDIIH